MWPSSPASTWALSSSAVTLLDEPIPNNKTEPLPPAAVAWDCGDEDAAAVPSASDERTRRIASIAVISGNWKDKKGRAGRSGSIGVDEAIGVTVS